MGKTRLAPGYRFHPTDVELVRYYLKRKVMGKTLPADAIAELDIYKFEPSDLPDKSYTKSGDLKWHFFCPREKKYSTGVRANRATGCGYWKTTGKERAVLCNGEVVGKIRTLIYHFGKSPRGERTDWVMHEYSLEDNELKQQNVPQDTYVLCVVFKKDGPGPRNGAQYGAPFKEEDWSEEEHLTTVPAISNPTTLHWPNEETSLVVAPSHDPIKDCFGGMIPESCASDFLPATATTSELPCLNDAASTPMSKPPPLIDPSCTASLPQTLHAPNNDDDIYSMLDHFVDEDEYLRFCEPNNSEVRHDPNVSAPPICIGEEVIFDELPDFMNMHNNSMLRTSSYDLIENSELYLNLQEFTALLAPPQTQTRNVSESYFTAPLAPPPNGNVTYLPAPLAPPQIGKTMGGEADMK